MPCLITTERVCGAMAPSTYLLLTYFQALSMCGAPRIWRDEMKREWQTFGWMMKPFSRDCMEIRLLHLGAKGKTKVQVLSVAFSSPYTQTYENITGKSDCNHYVNHQPLSRVFVGSGQWRVSGSGSQEYGYLSSLLFEDLHEAWGWIPTASAGRIKNAKETLWVQVWSESYPLSMSSLPRK